MIQINLPEISDIKKYPANELPEKERIYFLFDIDNKIIYIGMSNNIKKRIIQHINKKYYSPSAIKKEVYSVSCLLKEEYKYDSKSIERIYIDIYTPSYNDNKQRIGVLDLTNPIIKEGIRNWSRETDLKITPEERERDIIERFRKEKEYEVKRRELRRNIFG